VMQRIAVPMIGGMTSSTILTLVVIPAIYGLVKAWRLPAKPVPALEEMEALTLPQAAEWWEDIMINNMMRWTAAGWCGGKALLGLLGITVPVLAIAALVKSLVFR
jgi:hypothetical protein